MAAIHETPSAFAGNLLRITRSPAEPRPDLCRVPEDKFAQYADLCSGVLREARNLAAAGKYGWALSGLLARASDLLDDIDDFLIAMNPLRDGEAYLYAAELHRALEEIQARLPRQFRGRRFEPEKLAR